MCAAKIVKSKSDTMGWLYPVSSLSKSPRGLKMAKPQKSVHFAQTEATELSVSDEFQYSDSFESETKESVRTAPAPTTMEIITEDSDDSVEEPPSYSYTFEVLTEKPSKETLDGYTDTFENASFSSDTASQQDTLSPGNSFSSTYSMRADDLYDDDSNTENTMSSSWISRCSDEEASLNDFYSNTFEDATEYTSQFSRQEFVTDWKEVEEQRSNFISNLMERIKEQKWKGEASSDTIKKVRGLPHSKELKTYCKRKIKLLKEKEKSGERAAPSTKTYELLQQNPKPLSVRHYGIDPGVVERLKLKNLQMKLEKVIQEPIHDPKICQHCSTEEQRLTEIELTKNFLKSKTQQLEATSMDEKIQHHLIKMNSVNLIAEIARTLPKQSEDPLDIISKLNKPLRDKLAEENSQQQS